jgi:hypothetical protein
MTCSPSSFLRGFPSLLSTIFVRMPIVGVYQQPRFWSIALRYSRPLAVYSARCVIRRIMAEKILDVSNPQALPYAPRSTGMPTWAIPRPGRHVRRYFPLCRRLVCQFLVTGAITLPGIWPLLSSSRLVGATSEVDERQFNSSRLRRFDYFSLLPPILASPPPQSTPCVDGRHRQTAIILDSISLGAASPSSPCDSQVCHTLCQAVVAPPTPFSQKSPSLPLESLPLSLSKPSLFNIK